MKPFHPQAFYATDWAWDDALCRKRIERIMSGFGKTVDAVRILDEDGLAELIAQKGWLDLWRRQGTVGYDGDPDIVFNAFRWFEGDEWAALRQRQPILQQGQGFANSMLRALFGHPSRRHESARRPAIPSGSSSSRSSPFAAGARRRRQRWKCCSTASCRTT